MASKVKKYDNNTAIASFSIHSTFPGWLAVYYECGHATVCEQIGSLSSGAMCQLCKNGRDENGS